MCQLLLLFFHDLLLLASSLHLSSSSVFPRSVFRNFSHLSRCLLPVLQPSCFFVFTYFGNLSSFILTTCPTYFKTTHTDVSILFASPRWQQVGLHPRRGCAGEQPHVVCDAHDLGQVVQAQAPEAADAPRTSTVRSAAGEEELLFRSTRWRQQ